MDLKPLHPATKSNVIRKLVYSPNCAALATHFGCGVFLPVLLHLLDSDAVPVLTNSTR